jgi:hypothetical protein
MPFNVKKITREMEEFDLEKFKRSLIRPGASPESVEKIVEYIQKTNLTFKQR